MQRGPMAKFQPTIPQRLKLASEQWQQRLWQFACETRVACPGVIQDFDPVKQTVTVQLAVQEHVLIDNKMQPTSIKPLVDVPIVFPRAGNFIITLPVTEGDECLVIFGDNCIDSWFQSGGTDNVQMDRRRHDLSDGIAILGVWSQPNVLIEAANGNSDAFSISSMQLRSVDGKICVDIQDNEIDIVNDSTSAGTVFIHIQGDTVNIVAPKVVVNSSDKVTITGSNKVDIQSSTLVNVNGSGHTTIEGKDFLTHKHSGVTAGSSNTGNVV